MQPANADAAAIPVGDSAAKHITTGIPGGMAVNSPWEQELRKQEETRREAKKPADAINDNKPVGLMAGRIGHWAHRHKDYMSNNWLPWYGVRNAMSSVIGITALVSIWVPVKFGLNKLKLLTAGSENMIGKAVNKVVGNTIFENTLSVGLSFAGFRTGFKLSQRNYDRIFVKPQSEEEARKAVTDLPTNIAHDLRYLAPVEFPATLMAAFPLVAIRYGFRATGNTPGPDGLFRVTNRMNNGNTTSDVLQFVGWGGDSKIKDIIGCIPAYTAFFELGERIFDDWQTRRGYTANEHSHSHVKGILPPGEQSKEKKPYDTMLEDTPARMYFYKVASVAAGIVPYIAWSRYAQNNRGWQMNANDNFWKAWAKEQGMYQGFALYTVGSELARNNIDKLFKSLQDKELEKQHVASK